MKTSNKNKNKYGNEKRNSIHVNPSTNAGLTLNMKRNKQYEKEKALIKVKDEISENWDHIRSQAWIELDKPIAHGWNAVWTLRADIGRSPEAEILNYIIEKWGRKCWSKRKDFTAKDWRKRRWYDIKPHFVRIHEDDYLDLHPKLQKYFREDTSHKTWWRKEYVVYIDPWKLEMDISRSYITHYREHDEILYQIEAELDKKMYNITPTPWGGYNPPRWWRRCGRRKVKGKHQRENVDIVKTYNNGGDLDNYDNTNYQDTGDGWW